MNGTIRIRVVVWLATVVVFSVATTVVVMQAWRVDAAPGSAQSVVVNIDPTRILDTRSNVGLNGPFVSKIPQKLQVTGPVPTTTGTKVVVPPGATGVLLNVTVDQPSAAGFVAVRPGDASGQPATSSLNFGANQPLANGVQVALPVSGPQAGKIDMTYDAYGLTGPTTELLIDVVGYTVDSGVQDVAQRLPFAVTAFEPYIPPFSMTATPSPYVAVMLTAPVAGHVTVNSTAAVLHYGSTFGRVPCVITESTNVPSEINSSMESSQQFVVQDAYTGGFGTSGSLSGTRTFDIAADATVTYVLLCHEADGHAAISSANLTAIFTPAP